MSAHRFTFVLVASSLAALVACSGTPPEQTGTGDGAVVVHPVGSASGAPAKGADGSGATQGTGATAADGGAGKGAATGPSGKGAADPATDPDPACITSCQTNLAPKCMGDATFCNDVCANYDASEIACLVAAPTCEKSVWQACDAAAGVGTKGGDAGASNGK